MSLLNEYEALVKSVVDAGTDAEKASKGNKAAGTRLRKAMQDVKAKAQAIRKISLETPKS